MIKNILIVEDDISIAEIERDFLQINGYETTIVTDGFKGLNEAASGKYDMILLDVMLPNMDGFEICKRIRNNIDVPILMLTAKVEDVDKIRGLGIGADDYISKPFSLPELMARVKANLAQYERVKSGSSQETESKEIKIGNIFLNLQARRGYVDGQEIEFKTREFDLLCYLMTNPEIVFSKERLYEQIWGMDAFGDIRTVAVHINRLRDKIEKDPSNPTHIQTVWGAGYRFKI
ncbi:MAG: Two component transcriptional regulator, winged helix family [Herbinix sp.]|nr:Two component transcriptional regulator, winged helix family [Herbinix sp.]MDF2870036.1 Two component transcriptional regulator, winged helix family [Anaerocolumna sp.]